MVLYGIRISRQINSIRAAARGGGIPVVGLKIKCAYVLKTDRNYLDNIILILFIISYRG